MRAVALSDKTVQAKIKEFFVPLKIVIEPGTKEFPVDWPALSHWSKTYRKMGAEECEGITGCSVVSPDLEVEYANTGSAFVWEIFDSTAYDPVKFAAMLDRAQERFEAERGLLANEELRDGVKVRRLKHKRAQVAREIKREGRVRLPGRGFSKDGAVELFQLSGDLPRE